MFFLIKRMYHLSFAWTVLAICTICEVGLLTLLAFKYILTFQQTQNLYNICYMDEKLELICLHV